MPQDEGEAAGQADAAGLVDAAGGSMPGLQEELNWRHSEGSAPARPK